MQIHTQIAAALLSLAATSVLASDVIVIAHPSVSVTADDLRDVFLGDKQVAGAVKLQPLDNGSVQADFVAKVIKVDVNRYNQLWAKKAFREGINPPPVRGSDAEIINAVKTTPGAIGYVSKAPADVKVIQKY